jgi:hypothetical protein
MKEGNQMNNKKSRIVTITLTGAVLVAATFVGSEYLRNVEVPMVRYTYEGPAMTIFAGDESPWDSDSHMSGYFVYEELPPNTTVDFLDPDIEWPIPNLPKEFLFTDGARSITESQLEESIRDTSSRVDPNVYEVRAFSVRTDEAGDIVAWDVLFVHNVRNNTFVTAHNGGIYGQDMTEVNAEQFGCGGAAKCTGISNYTSPDAVLPNTQFAGSWTKETLW